MKTDVRRLTEKQRQIKKEIAENIWYKLYLLQNYKITQNMFIGSPIRWKSIETYAGFVRNIYNGKLDGFNLAHITPSLYKYIKGLMDSGVEPYPSPNKKDKKVSVDYLIKNKILSSYQIKQIYDPVSKQDNKPDTSISGSRNVLTRNKSNHFTGNYYEIVQKQDIPRENKNVCNIINNAKRDKNLIFNPLQFNIKKDFTLRELFNQILK